MCSLKEWLIFLAGAETLHTIKHIIIGFSGSLPIKFYSIRWTQQLNTIAIIVNALITAALFWWIFQLP